MTYYGAKHLADSFRTVRKNTLAIAEEIPEDKYGFKATPDVMSVGEMLAHLAVSPMWQIDVHSTKKMDSVDFAFFAAHLQQSKSEEQLLRTKAEIIRALTENGPDTPACKAEADYREQFRGAVAKTMDANKLDAFVYPTWSNPPRLIGDLNTPHGDNSQFFSPTTGFPSIQVPMGYTRGGQLPAGMTFFGRAWDETTLIGLAYAFEQQTKHRHPPAAAPELK